jgi:polysaccharide transporter, PST family
MSISKRFQKLLLLRDRTGLRKILSNISWLFADRILRMGCGLMVGVWVARYLGAEQFGMFSYATAFFALLSPLATLGLDTIVVSRLVGDPSQQQRILGTSFWMRFLAGWLTWAISILGILLLRHDDRTTITIVVILGFTSIFQSVDTIDLWFQSQVKSKYSVLAKNIAFVISTLLKVVLITTHASLVAFAWVSLLEFGLGAIGLLIVYKQQGHLIRLWLWSKSLAKDLIKESWPLILSGLSIMIYMKIYQIMLGEMVGGKAVGIYSVATRISEIWYFIPMAIVPSASPSIYAAKKIGEDGYYRKIKQLIRLMVLMPVIVTIPVSFLSVSIITTLFGNEYAESGQILAVHIWAGVFVFMGVATSPWFTAEGLNHLSFQRTFLGGITNVILN